MKRAIDRQKCELEEILNSNLKANYTTSLGNIPCMTHSTVEEYFKLAGDKKYCGIELMLSRKLKCLTKVYKLILYLGINKIFIKRLYQTFYKTSYKINIYQGACLYKCRIVFDSKTNKI